MNKKTVMKKEELKTAEAFLKALRTSPLKLRRLTRVVTGMPVEKAIMHLSFSKIRVAKPLVEVIKSAIANAENNHNMDIDNLVIHRIDVGKSFTMKRFRPRAKGRADRILKPFSNLRVVLIEKSEE